MDIKKLREKEEVDLRFSNHIKAVVDIMKPQNIYLIGGRGLAKTTDIIAGRCHDMIFEMPRAAFAFTGDTYVNLMTNVLPNIIMGWEQRYDFHNEIDFVVDKQPNFSAGWDRPLYSKTLSYKHSLSTLNGCKFYFTSLDRPSTNAGISVVGLLGDEAKYFKKQKIKKLIPTLRGDPEIFGHSPYFLGKTFCTDMPDPLIGEDEWILEMENDMDISQARKALEAGMIVNDISIELFEAEEKGELHKVDNIKRKLERWLERHKKIRFGLTFFYIGSSFANIDILTLEYFENQKRTLDKPEFDTAISSIRRKLEPGEKFYPNLADKHFFADGYNYTYYDQFGVLDNIKQTSAGLRYVDYSSHLEAGLDAGNMMSLVIGQQHGNIYRLLKDIFTLPPDWIRELANVYLDFFEPQKCKILKLWYDRGANQYRKVKQDVATKVKNAIEKREGPVSHKMISTGWKVILMSIGQGDIKHLEEFDLMNVLMGETDKRLPRLLIDQHECKHLKSSLEHAPITKDSKGQIKKDKSSEKKLPLKRLPLESTNISDAFKYLMCRKEWMNILNNRIEGGNDYTAKVY